MDGNYVYKEGGAGGQTFNGKFHLVFRNTSLIIKKKQDSQHILYYTWYKSMREIRTCCEKWWSFLWAVCFRLEAFLSGNCQYQIE